MKTLDKEVQVAIINEAGSTFRTYLLSMAKDGCEAENCLSWANQAAQKFIDLCTKNAGTDGVKIVNGSVTASKINVSSLSAIGKLGILTLYQWALTQPSVPDFCVYNWETGNAVSGSKLAGWSFTVPARGVGGESLFELKVNVSAQGDEVFSAVPFKDYKMQTIAYAGKQGI